MIYIYKLFWPVKYTEFSPVNYQIPDTDSSAFVIILSLCNFVFLQSDPLKLFKT